MQSIPANELAEHIRIELLDPQWREQKLRLERERAAGQEVYASGEFLLYQIIFLSAKGSNFIHFSSKTFY